MAAYKSVQRKSTVAAAIGDALSALQELGGECREIVNNASEGLSQTQRIQTLDETANALECLDEPNIPEHLAELEVVYSEAVPTRARAFPSRATRCNNAVAMIEGAKDAIDQWMSDNPVPEKSGKDDDTTDEQIAEADQRHDDANSLFGELDEITGEAENCEFPGMFG